MRRHDHVAVPLRDLVVQDQGVPPDGGHQAADQPVVLVGVVEAWASTRSADGARAATSSSDSFTSPQWAGRRPSGRSNWKTVASGRTREPPPRASRPGAAEPVRTTA